MEFDYFNSDHKIINTIETNLVHLMIRIAEEECLIDENIKNQISKALDIYDNHINIVRQKGELSRHKTFKLKDLIIKIAIKLDEAGTLKETSSAASLTTDNLQTIKQKIFEIEKKTESQQIEEQEFKKLLDEVNNYSKILNNSGSELGPNEQCSISLLFLNLFLKSAPTKISEYLQPCLDNLDNINKIFTIFDLKKVNIFTLEEIEPILFEVNKKVEDLNFLTNQALKEINFKINTSQETSEDQTSDIQNLLKEINDNLSECEMLANKVTSPTEHRALDFIEKRISFILKNQLSGLSTQESEIEERKKFLFNKGMRISRKLNYIDRKNIEVNEHLEKLHDLEIKILSVVNGGGSYEDKTRELGILEQEINDLNTKSNEVRNRKNLLLNKLTGFVIFETATYLRAIKKCILQFKNYATEFGFPKKSKTYEFRIQEIVSLNQLLDKIPRGDDFSDQRVNSMKREIDDILETIERKALENQSFFNVLNNFEIIEKKIQFMENLPNSNLTKLKELNNYRRRLLIMDSFDQKINETRRELFVKIYKIEDGIYVKECSDIQLQTIKTKLNEYEINIQQLMTENSTEQLQEQKKQLHTLLEDILKLCADDNKLTEIIKVLTETVTISCEFLDKIIKENNNVQECLENLDGIMKKTRALCSAEEPIKQIELLEEYNNMMQIIKLSWNENQILDKLVDVENIISVEKSKLELEDMNSKLKLLKEGINQQSIPVPPFIFKEQINSLFSIKETVTDIPEGNPELTTQKEKFLEEVQKILQDLDENVASAARAKNVQENLVELGDPFNSFDVEILEDTRKSKEIFQIMFQRVEHLDSFVKYYLGPKNSIDSKTMLKHLMLLLKKFELYLNDESVMAECDEVLKWITKLINLLK